MPLSDPHVQALHEATRGHPLLLKLSLGLLREGEPVDTVVGQLANGRSAEALFVRIWKRLDDDARTLLMALAVHRSTCYTDAWQAHRPMLDRLIGAELASLGANGGVSVTPHVRELALTHAPADMLPVLHLRAAHLHEVRGEFTVAAWHYAQAGNPHKQFGYGSTIASPRPTRGTPPQPMKSSAASSSATWLMMLGAC